MALPNNPTQAQTVKAIKDLETNKADSSALSSYFPKSGGALNSGAVITMTGGNPYLGLKETSGTQYYLQGYQGEVGISVSGNWGTKRISLDSNGKVFIPSKSIGDGTYTYTLPNKTGTVAMTSDIPTSYVSSVNGSTGAITNVAKMALSTQTGSFYATSFYASSDRRLKENIKPAELDCGKVIDDLQIKEFNFKSDEEKKVVVGAIAQELQEILPEKYRAELINGSEDTHYSINEGKLLFIAIGALKEERAKTKELEERLAKLEKMLGV